MKRKNKGFTLIELVIVIAILAILVAIAIPRFGKSNLSAQATAHNVNVREVKNAAIMYMTDKQREKITAISMADLKDYFDNEFPKPAKSMGENFEVSVDTSGNIKVTPGIVEVVGNEIKLVEGQK
ncbi:type II secretion system protein [Anaerosphaera multitolerans]|uniref:Type II secretion system protein n=1 Tax=Anaerosphaera multitolerans TaxID=2487351 RepID=A0A437S8Z3_9FIRM|nr:type II secretion system protein [Anaerosphaera multitolerans]RVU55308.1 type II secretion system protein [Anaerosphaera multitolerans]